MTIAANAGRTTSPCKRQVAGSNPAGSIMGARSSAVERVGVFPNPRRREPEFEIIGECRKDYMGRGFDSRRVERRVAQWVERSFQILVAKGHADVVDRRMPAGLHGESTCLRAGGRRFNSAPGQPGSSARMSGHLSSPHRSLNGRMQAGLHGMKGGSNPPLGRELGRMSRQCLSPQRDG
jgi:hypothetical protein